MGLQCTGQMIWPHFWLQCMVLRSHLQEVCRLVWAFKTVRKMVYIRVLLCLLSQVFKSKQLSPVWLFFLQSSSWGFCVSVFVMVTLTTAHWFEFKTAEKLLLFSRKCSAPPVTKLRLYVVQKDTSIRVFLGLLGGAITVSEPSSSLTWIWGLIWTMNNIWIFF